jgi:hypothetical protein
MPIYEIAPDKNSIRQVSETSFGAEGVRERDDLQRLLRSQIEILCSVSSQMAHRVAER